MSTPSDMHTNGASPQDPEAIKADIERTRANLTETVDALAAKLDIRTRARAKAAEVRRSATTASGAPRPELIGAGVAALLLVAGLVWWRRR